MNYTTIAPLSMDAEAGFAPALMESKSTFLLLEDSAKLIVLRVTLSFHITVNLALTHTEIFFHLAVSKSVFATTLHVLFAFVFVGITHKLSFRSISFNILYRDDVVHQQHHPSLKVKALLGIEIYARLCRLTVDNLRHYRLHICNA